MVTIEGPAYLHCLSVRGVRIGSHTSIDRNLWLHCGGTLDDYAHGFFEIGEHSYIGCNAVMGAGGGIRIGSHVLIGQAVNMHSESHQFSDSERLIREQGVSYQGIKVEDDVWIGSKATILDGTTIGRGAVIGAGAVVTRSVLPYTIVAGVPARVIGARGQDAG
jgi:acetyltransferase-like isoleucine patch superfamily enzyme